MAGNNSTESTLDEPKFFIGVSFAIGSAIGLMVNMLFLIICMSSKKRLNSPFDKILWNVAVSDMGILLSITVSAPSPLGPSNKTFTAELLGNLNTAFFYALISLVLTLTINRLFRLVNANLPNSHDVFFLGQRTSCWIGSCWVFSLSVPAFVNLAGCWKPFAVDRYVFEYACKKSTAAQAAYWIAKVVGLGLSVFGILLHFWMHMRVRKARVGPFSRPVSRMTAARHGVSDMSLLVQATVISAILLLENLSLWVFPLLLRNGPWSLLITGWIVIISSSVNPVTSWIFNPKIRQASKRLLYCCLCKEIETETEPRASPLRSVVVGLQFLNKIQRALRKKSELPPATAQVEPPAAEVELRVVHAQVEPPAVQVEFGAFHA